MDYRKTGEMTWEWSHGGKHYSVRYFPDRNSLIWSGWVDTRDGPQFDDGVRQSAARFLAVGAPQGDPPDALLAELHRAIAPGDEDSIEPSAKRSWFGRLWRGE